MTGSKFFIIQQTIEEEHLCKPHIKATSSIKMKHLQQIAFQFPTT